MCLILKQLNKHGAFQISRTTTLIFLATRVNGNLLEHKWKTNRLQNPFFSGNKEKTYLALCYIAAYIVLALWKIQSLLHCCRCIMSQVFKILLKFSVTVPWKAAKPLSFEMELCIYCNQDHQKEEIYNLIVISQMVAFSSL